MPFICVKCEERCAHHDQRDGLCPGCANPQPNFSGPVYDPEQDFERLTKQHERIRDLMRDGVWRTVYDIAKHTRDPENSIQAQLRHLRKPRFGGWIVEKSKSEYAGAPWFYRLRARVESDPPYAGGQSSKNLKGKIRKLIGLLEEACDALEERPDLFARMTCKSLRRRMEELGE